MTETTILIALIISLLGNIVLGLRLAGMLPPEIASLLAAAIPTDVLREYKESFATYLEEDGRKWNDIFVPAIEYGGDVAIKELEESRTENPIVVGTQDESATTPPTS